MPKNVNLDEWRGIWVYAEQRRGEVSPVTWELVGAARRLADAVDTYVAVVLIGDGVGRYAEQAFAFGADKAFVAGHPELAEFRTEVYGRLVVDLVLERKPEIFLLPATTQGRDLASTVATDLACGLTADTTQLEMDVEKRMLLATRPTFGGQQLATITSARWRPQMATVRPKVMPRPEPVPGRTGEVIRLEVGDVGADAPTRVLRVVEESNESRILDEADVIVAAGRGIGSKANLYLVEELAEALGGQVAGSRPVCDAGWLPKARQIGQTGITVRPKLYVAVGISGAIQHVVGMMQSGTIVAINADPKAPIFQVAHVGIVGDLFKVVPALTQAVRQRGRRAVLETVGG